MQFISKGDITFMRFMKYIVILLMLTFMLSVTGCMISNDFEAKSTNQETNFEFDETLTTSNADKVKLTVPIVDDNNTRYISNSLSRKGAYITFESLNKVSSNIIAGICISSKPKFQNNTLYTLSEVKITHVYKGNFEIGDVILIEELGGRTTFGEYEKGCNIEQKVFETGLDRISSDSIIVVGNDGYFPLKNSDEVLLFVDDTKGFLKDIKEPVYGIWGTYDGKLYLQEDGSYARPLPTLTDNFEFGEGTLKIGIDELNSIK
jgi:hypothetical protein